MTAPQERLDGTLSRLAAVERAVVHVHADEAVGGGPVDPAPELESVGQGLLAILEGELDAGPQEARHVRDDRSAEVAPGDVPSQGKRQAPGVAPPPGTQIDGLVDSAAAVGELTFMNQQAGLLGSAFDRLQDPIEGNHDRPHVAQAEPEGQGRRGEAARDGDGHPPQIVRPRGRPRHHQRTVPLPHAGPAAQERVTLRQVGVGVERDGGHVDLAFESEAIEALDVVQDLHHLVAGGRHASAGEAVEHEGIVGIRAVPHPDRPSRLILRRHATPPGRGGIITPARSGFGGARGLRRGRRRATPSRRRR